MTMRSAVLVAMVLAAPVTAAARDELRVVVRVGPAVDRPESERLVSAVRAQLRGTATVATSGAGAICIVALDRDGAQELVVRFLDDSGRSLAAERTVAHGGELGASEIGTIVRAFVVALGDRERPAEPAVAATNPAPAVLSAAAAAATSPAPLSTAAAPALAAAVVAGPLGAPAASGVVERPSVVAAPVLEPWHARIGAFYTGSSVGQGLVWQSGVRVEAVAALPHRLFVGVGYAYFPSSDVVSETASVRLGRHAGGAYVGLERGGPRFGLGLDVGAGVAADVRSTASAGQGFAATPDATHVSPTFSVRLHGRYRIPQAQVFAVDVAPAFELAPGGRDLVVDEGKSTGPTTLLSPSLARFRLDLGATFDAF